MALGAYLPGEYLNAEDEKELRPKWNGTYAFIGLG